MRTIIYDVYDETQLGWLVIKNGKYEYKPLKKDSKIHDAQGNVYLGRFGNSENRNEKTTLGRGNYERNKLNYNVVNNQNKEKTSEPSNETKLNPRTQVYPVFRYKNYSRKSGVYAYAYSPDNTIIYVYFLGKKRGWYKYDQFSSNKSMIERMIQLAKKGWGLNRFINKHPQTYYWKGTHDLF